MNLHKNILLLMLFMMTALPGQPQDSHSIFNMVDEEKCSTVALKYVIGYKADAQKLAKELLLLFGDRFKGSHSHIVECNINMLRAVVNNDDKAVENYMENFYHSEDIRYNGLKFGLKEKLHWLERALALVAIKEGTSSSGYFEEGCCVAALMYEVGRKEEAKSLAAKLIVLVPSLKAVEEKKPKEAWGKISYEADEVMLRNILNDNNDSVLYCASRCGDQFESMGARLEEAYGKIYLYKRLKMNLDHLAYAYNYLGWAQAVAANYDESERAYKMALRLAKEQFGTDYPEIVLEIRSDYAAMLKLAGKPDEAAAVAKGITPESLKEVEAKAHPDRKPYHLYGMPPGWGP